jgi:hypothetical protein
VVIGTDCIGSCKSNYLTITTVKWKYKSDVHSDKILSKFHGINSIREKPIFLAFLNQIVHDFQNRKKWILKFSFTRTALLKTIVLFSGWFMVFSNISVISWRSVLLVEETGIPGENHRPVANHWYIGITELTSTKMMCLCEKSTKIGVHVLKSFYSSKVVNILIWLQFKYKYDGRHMFIYIFINLIMLSVYCSLYSCLFLLLLNE